MDGDTVTALPMHALVSQATMAFQIDYEEMAHWGMAGTARLAQLMAGGEAPLGEVGAVLGVDGSGRTGLERHGVVRVRTEGSTPVAELTPRGRVLVEGHSSRLDAVIGGWRTRYGATVIDEVEHALRAVDAKLASDLPDYVVVRFWRMLSL